MRQGSSLRRRKAARLRHNRHGITVIDSKYTGEEPIWDGWETWPIQKFVDERNRSMNWYAYYAKRSDQFKPEVLSWMEANGYSKEDIRAVRRAPYYLPGPTVCGLCTAMNRGMPALHPKMQAYHDSEKNIGGTAKSDADFVRGTLIETIRVGRGTAKTELELNEETGLPIEKKGPIGVSPMDHLREKVNSTVIVDLDILWDRWMDDKFGALSVLDVFEKMKEYKLPGAACNQITQRLELKLKAFSSALDRSDPTLADGYSYLSAKELQERIDALQTMIADVEKFKFTIKANRTPRAKKMPSAIKQTERLKYKKQTDDGKIVSINPVRIIGAHRLLAYSVKYKAIFDFYSNSGAGFAIKGTTLQNVDLGKCRYKRLREKVSETFLPAVLSTTEKQLEKAWMGLTTKEGKPKSRINSEMILLRVFDHGHADED